jgi:hypothetical protein
VGAGAQCARAGRAPQRAADLHGARLGLAARRARDGREGPLEEPDHPLEGDVPGRLAHGGRAAGDHRDAARPGGQLQFARELSDAPGLIALMIVVLMIGILVDGLVFAALERRIRRRRGLVDVGA